jgi:hypothetical protein
METLLKFLFDLLSQFFLGFKDIVLGLLNGIKEIFNILAYISIINDYKADFSVGEWILAGLAIILIIALMGFVVFLIYLLVRKYIRFRKTLVEQESLLEEVAELNSEVAKMMKEKEDILAMKVSNLGIKPTEEGEEAGATNEEEEDNKPVGDTRFAKLTQVDEEYKTYKIKNYGNSFTLPELIDNFRNFAAAKLKLFYTEDMIRIFIASLSCTKLVILQGISGTGKTSLAYAWGKFLKHDSCVASVQPSWRDRTELFGYFNEFTKKFNETDVLREVYEAGYTDDIYTIILDEMNIARVEYYFAEMLSILEMPDKSEWVVELVSSGWKSDPKRVVNGKLLLPVNIWYIGTINNDDSTFMVTDKVYDRAMPIDINDKGKIFKPRDDAEAQDINYSYLQGLFDTSYEANPVSQASLDKIEILDNYVIEHFRIAFGNRIVMQMKKFVPTFVACKGDEVAGIDYFLARKVLRKFEQLNISYIRDEIDGFIDFLDKTFGKDKMKECKEYLLRLKKMT